MNKIAAKEISHLNIHRQVNEQHMGRTLTVRIRSIVLACAAPARRAKTWFATARMYAVPLSRKPMTVSTSTSTGSGTSFSFPLSSPGAPDDLRLFLPFFASAGNIREAPSRQFYRTEQEPIATETSDEIGVSNGRYQYAGHGLTSRDSGSASSSSVQ